MEKSVRDAIEGPPRFEKAESEPKRKTVDEKTEAGIPPASIVVTPKNAHSIALQLLKDEDAVKSLKFMIAKKLVSKEHITKLDQWLAESKDAEYYELYGLTPEHLMDIENGKFMMFDLVPDGESFAITFTKKTGDKALRPINDEVLAEMLKSLFETKSELISTVNIQSEEVANR